MSLDVNHVCITVSLHNENQLINKKNIYNAHNSQAQDQIKNTDIRYVAWDTQIYDWVKSWVLKWYLNVAKVWINLMAMSKSFHTDGSE